MKHSTKSVWGGEEKSLIAGATQVPIVSSVVFAYDDVDKWSDVILGKEDGYIYGRMTNPTVDAFEEKVRVLEDAEAAVSFATGMAAISNALFTLLSPGDRVVSVKDTYGGTNKLFIDHLPRFGIEVTLCDTTDHEALEKEIKKGCKVLYLETPTNPTMKLIDIARLSKAAHQVGAIVITDNTMATPINQNPLQLGSDLVVHSATKYLGGHGDALGGVICGPKNLVNQIYEYRMINGAPLDPNAAYSLIRGMKTLQIRIERQNENAMEIASFLKKQPLVEDVFYPGLTDDPSHELAKKQMNGFGGMLSFSLKGGLEAVNEFLPRLRFAHLAANLGAVETTVGPVHTTSHAECTLEERKAMGIPEGLVRYSVGIENASDLIEDLEQAFKYIENKITVK
ncbi:cystathionine gamma-synthase family protein [Siminovitchia acidinfaciens]|uniref:homocysteine desulfhydrase n=1 Tax=Siminovitchia acidinfaciens TaxID=2321395 RepID=A0A429XSZ4_9BACI|nr:cystathionine gamma-synthase family protein [Siminovitchia acidinfaciens]RST70818.1 cystathionine gamma-synthase family protein [Siminovitchia acidinfaciens]